LFEDLHVLQCRDAPDQSVFDRVAGFVGGMDDAAVRMTALARQMIIVALAREGDAEFIQLADGGGAVFDDETHGRLIAKSCTGDQSVLHMRIGGVVLIDDGGDATLGPIGRAAFDRAFGEDGDFRGAGKVKGGGQPGCTAADDGDVETVIGVTWR